MVGWSQEQQGKILQNYFLVVGDALVVAGNLYSGMYLFCRYAHLATGLVRENGVVNNWVWWAFFITGMVTVFIYAKLWRRSEVMTDLEVYELRYGGKLAAFLRGFRSLYLGVILNCLIMETVSLAAIKIGAVMLGLDPLTVVVGASIVVVIYAAVGGIKGVVCADFISGCLGFSCG